MYWLCHKFIKLRMSSQERFRQKSSSERFRKNQSMNSTHHMSCNHSHATNFFPEGALHSNANECLLCYSHIPMSKDCARWNQSAATWRHTAKKYSFSKDQRFKQSSFYHTDIIEPQIPSSLSSKSCTFGKDIKKPISVIVLRNAKEKPAPDRYDIS